VFCTSCGTKSSAEGQKFCDNCGVVLQSSNPQGAPPANSYAPGSGTQAPTPQDFYQGFPHAPEINGTPYYGDPGRVTALNFIQAIKYCFANYFTAKGRASRSEYWYFYLGGLIYFGIVGTMFPNENDSGIAGLLVWVWVIPQIFSGIRRMHDVSKSGWYLLIPIYNLILLCTEGETVPNHYGIPVDYRGLV